MRRRGSTRRANDNPPDGDTPGRIVLVGGFAVTVVGRNRDVPDRAVAPWPARSEQGQADAAPDGPVENGTEAETPPRLTRKRAHNIV